MARRKSWDELSPEYRKRLARHGLTPAKHAAGESIRAARGHANTPERVPTTDANPQKWTDYWARKDDLVGQFVRKKERLFGHEVGYHDRRAENAVRDVDIPTDLLRWALRASEIQLRQYASLAATDPEEFGQYAFLFYH